MSTASLARIEANQRNAALSTGPRTPEGKAASRANSLKHGMTGAGVVVPEQDLLRIAGMAQDICDKHHPTTEVGLAMADRAAMLLVRLQRAGLHEMAMVADQVATALQDFDQFRLDWADDLFGELATNPNALRQLEQFPEGIDRLLAEWSTLEALEDWSPEDLARAANLSVAGGLGPDHPPGLDPGRGSSTQSRPGRRRLAADPSSPRTSREPRSLQRLARGDPRPEV